MIFLGRGPDSAAPHPGDVSTCTFPLPRLFSLGPEFHRGRYENSGVMMFNLPAFRAELPAMVRFGASKDFVEGFNPGYDQGGWVGGWVDGFGGSWRGGAGRGGAGRGAFLLSTTPKPTTCTAALLARPCTCPPGVPASLGPHPPACLPPRAARLTARLSRPRRLVQCLPGLGQPDGRGLSPPLQLQRLLGPRVAGHHPALAGPQALALPALLPGAPAQRHRPQPCSGHKQGLPGLPARLLCPLPAHARRGRHVCAGGGAAPQICGAGAGGRRCGNVCSASWRWGGRLRPC